MPGDESLHSRRALNLRFNIPISKTREFWEALKEGRLTTTRCKKCGRVTFPPQADCPGCMSSEHEWVSLDSEAELVTYTHVQVTPTSFVDSEPYIVAIGRLLKSGINILAWMEGVRVEDLKPGDRLRLEARSGGGGNPYYVFVRA